MTPDEYCHRKLPLIWGERWDCVCVLHRLDQARDTVAHSDGYRLLDPAIGSLKIHTPVSSARRSGRQAAPYGPRTSWNAESRGCRRVSRPKGKARVMSRVGLALELMLPRTMSSTIYILGVQSVRGKVCSLQQHAYPLNSFFTCSGSSPIGIAC